MRKSSALLIRQVVLLCLLPLAAAVKAQDKFLISGYGNMHYMDHSGTPRQFGQKNLDKSFVQLREFSLFMDFSISSTIVASTELEAGDNGNRYTANYAYVDIQARDNFSFRAGKILVPFLSYNENKPNFRQTLMSAPFTAWNIVPVVGLPLGFHGVGWSDVGVTANWNTLVGEVGVVDVKLSAINGLGSDSNVLDDNTIQLDLGAGSAVQPTIRPRDGLLQNEGNNELRDNNNNKALVAKISFKSLSLPLDLGLSLYRGTWDPADEKNLQMFGVHVNLVETRWMFKGEYVKAAVEQDAGFDPVAARGLAGPGSVNTSQGDYNMLAWYMEGSFVPLMWEEDRYLRLVMRFDDLDTNDKAAFTPWDRRRVTVGTEWQFAPNTRLRYEWQQSTIDDIERAPVPFVQAGGKEKITMHMASMIFSF